ncbi:MAG TPA: hypothetical protein PK322_15170, partial [Opitutaceae bacterium]|nr:hypothetical protein [Opitutaceae bacterium]
MPAMNLSPDGNRSQNNQLDETKVRPRDRLPALVAIAISLLALGLVVAARADNEYGFDYQELQYRAKNLAAK